MNRLPTGFSLLGDDPIVDLVILKCFGKKSNLGAKKDGKFKNKKSHF